MTEENSRRGKRSRTSGRNFELKVRKDLEKNGWVVSKWMNNVGALKATHALEWEGGWGLVPAKHKFNGPGRPMAIGTGFPDFIMYKQILAHRLENEERVIEIPLHGTYQIIGVEVKLNGYLDRTEKQKCEWLLSRDIFSEILIASKGKKRGEIVYKKFTIPQKPGPGFTN